MSIVTVTQVVSAPQSAVWDAISDFHGIYRFHPRVARSPKVGEIERGLGVSRRCEFHDGNHVVEEVTAWHEGKSLEVDITEGTMPLKSAHAHIEIEAVDANHTEVRFTMDYEPKFGLLGKAMDAVMMRSQFRKILGSVIDGLDTHLATGAVIGLDGRPEQVAA